MVAFFVFFALPFATIGCFVGGLRKWGFFWLTLWVGIWGLFILSK